LYWKGAITVDKSGCGQARACLRVEGGGCEIDGVGGDEGQEFLFIVRVLT